MAMSGGRDDGEPMMEMNTTPLIDVMLVLLIMFIITIPIQTHAVKVDLPQNSNQSAPPVEPQKNKLYIDANGNVFWNSVQIDDVTLRQYLDASLAQDPEPELHFQPDPQARYDVVDRVLAIVKRANVTKLGFVGNEQYRNDF
ncbi:biopolymer transport protein ExbD [Sphingomonas naasensis]|uniref:Biopolymer transporter ExbD n=1 Tax=Sphingomonas naasensis TaxID=1344951 RepID=A0A4S1WX59_9SPHN|nr:biopolymer transporter ExbD [Sphingomonas naasensis]NIJ18986.1 biopolymer transport protein ExbD [Sphingomonas naasensis]TGX46196.1 biopolymer transporter ExbD [Sphingomonas naasensis]